MYILKYEDFLQYLQHGLVALFVLISHYMYSEKNNYLCGKTFFLHWCNKRNEKPLNFLIYHHTSVLVLNHHHRCEIVSYEKGCRAAKENGVSNQLNYIVINFNNLPSHPSDINIIVWKIITALTSQLNIPSATKYTWNSSKILCKDCQV